MSSDKIKKQERRFYNDVKIKKQQVINSYYNKNSTIQPGKFRKHHALNCGNSKCVFCSNPRRVFKDKTLKEHSSDFIFKYDLENL